MRRAGAGNHIITTAIEHHAGLHAAQYLEENGFEVTYVGCDPEGRVRAADVEAALRPGTVLASVMLANNEVGTLQPVAEIARLSMTASRRLQLAAEAGGTLGLAVPPLPRSRPADAFALPSAAVTRWRVSARPSAPLPVPGIGRARWLLQLIRCRAGAAADFDVEAPDAEGRIAFSSGLADRPPSAGARRCAPG